VERNRIVMPVLLVCGLVFSPAVGRGTDAITLVRDGQPRAAIWLSTRCRSRLAGISQSDVGREIVHP
jgi:hypothetical protein